jgi:hypothetical protein
MFDVAGKDYQTGCVSLQTRTIEIAFDAEHQEWPDLPVVSSLTGAKETIGRLRRDR